MNAETKMKQVDALVYEFKAGESLFSYNQENGHVVKCNNELRRVAGKWVLATATVCAEPFCARLDNRRRSSGETRGPKQWPE